MCSVRPGSSIYSNSHSGKVSGQTFGTATTAPAINLLRIEETLSAAHLRLAGGTYIEQLDWSACIDRYDRPHTLFMQILPISRRRAMACRLLGSSTS